VRARRTAARVRARRWRLAAAWLSVAAVATRGGRGYP
jgi:hypothetical protein